MSKRPDWQPEEDQLLDRYVQAWRDKKYHSRMAATDAFISALAELRKRHPDWEWLRHPRPRPGIYCRFKKRADPTPSRTTSMSWTKPELEILGRVVRGVRDRKYRTLGGAAQAGLEALDEARLAYSQARYAPRARTPAGVRSKLGELLARAGRVPTRSHWSRAEGQVVERYARELLNGGHRYTRNAARKCRQELERLRRDRPNDFAPRTYLAVRSQLTVRARALGRDAGNKPWTGEERRVLDGFVRALGQRRYGVMGRVVDDYLKEVKRLRGIYPDAKWLRIPRTRLAVYTAIWKRWRKQRKMALSSHWTVEELRLVDRYCRRVIAGRIRSARQAAREYLEEVKCLRRRYPREPWLQKQRGFRNVHNLMCKRAVELGRPMTAVPWSGPERVIVDRCARALAQGDYRSAQAAARDCIKDIEQLHRDRPRERWARVKRTLCAAVGHIRASAIAMQAQWALSAWTAEEKRIFDEHAQGFMTGRFHTVVEAAQSAWHQMLVKHQRRQRKKPGRLRTPMPRRLKSVLEQLRRRTARLGRRGHAQWSPAEDRVAHDWARRVIAARAKPPATVRQATTQMMLQLRRLDFRREARNCRANLRKHIVRMGHPELLIWWKRTLQRAQT